MGLTVSSASPRWLLVGVAGLVAVASATLGRSSSVPQAQVLSAQRVTTQGGRAVAVSVRSEVNQVVADTGDLRDPALSPVRRSVAELPGPVLRGSRIEASVLIPAPGSVRAETFVNDLTVDLTGPPPSFPPSSFPPPTSPPTSFFEGPALATLNRAAQTEMPADVNFVSVQTTSAESQSSCAGGSSGLSRVGPILVNDVPVPVTALPPPNTVVTMLFVPRVVVVLNEQIPAAVPGGSGLTVNAVHITSSDGFDLVVGSARSDVGGCGPPEEPIILPDPVVSVQPAVVRRGRVLTVSGSLFPASAPVQLTFDGPDLRPVEVVAGPDGVIEVAVVVPRDARLGDRTLTATSGDKSATATFLVVRPPVQPPAAPFGQGPSG